MSTAKTGTGEVGGMLRPRVLRNYWPPGVLEVNVLPAIALAYWMMNCSRKLYASLARNGLDALRGGPQKTNKKRSNLWVDPEHGIPAGISHPWIYTNTGILNGGVTTQTILTNLLGLEADGEWIQTWACLNPRPTIRANITKLAISPFKGRAPLCADESDGQGYVSIYSVPSGAQVFATGSMYWNWGLDDFGYPVRAEPPDPRTNSVAKQITHNVLRTEVTYEIF